MKVTENAIGNLKNFVQPNSGLAEGIRIAQGNGCCGPAIGISKVKQPYQSDLGEIHEGINFYIDPIFAEVANEIVLDFENNYYNIKGIESKASSGCC